MIDFLDYKLRDKSNITISIKDSFDEFSEIFKEINNNIIIIYTNNESFAKYLYNYIYTNISKYNLKYPPLCIKNYIGFDNGRIFFVYNDIYKHIVQFEKIYTEKIKYIISDEVLLFDNYKSIILDNDGENIKNDYKIFKRLKKIKKITYENI